MPSIFHFSFSVPSKNNLCRHLDLAKLFATSFCKKVYSWVPNKLTPHLLTFQFFQPPNLLYTLPHLIIFVVIINEKIANSCKTKN